MLGGDEMVRLIEGVLQFKPIDFDVGDVEFVLCEFGAAYDEPPVSVGGCSVFGALRKEAFAASLQEIAQGWVQHSREGEAVVR